jgi:hypothetical protein
MADFGGLAINLQAIQTNEISLTRGAKGGKKSDLSSSTNVRVNPKLLQILKDNQEELIDEQQLQQQIDDLNNNRMNGNSIVKPSLDVYANGGMIMEPEMMESSDENKVNELHSQNLILKILEKKNIIKKDDIEQYFFFAT